MVSSPWALSAKRRREGGLGLRSYGAPGVWTRTVWKSLVQDAASQPTGGRRHVPVCEQMHSGVVRFFSAGRWGTVGRRLRPWRERRGRVAE